ncbi:hemolysin secretion protein D [Paenibacillus sp. CCS19]|uniref:efflux RND transporter periplasmic adaptor subunit n=1 Tax=Paenibacillus sp. CCS19 TaxID=3158387 RepID=UPI00256B93BF|nr:efflux RND transporter periplasmic adaptor subunit [Paenibacillus cellulosilyticus]GMK39640.1 hemolysin secretion protein D [Paenibacillus cellulosilyticus]
MRTIASSVGVASLIVAALSGCSLLPKEEEAIPPPLVKPAEQKFDVVDVKKGELAIYFKGIATVVSKSQQDVFFKQGGGRLAAVHVSQGDTVKKGQLLIELGSDDLKLRLELQKISYERTQIDLQSAIKGGNEDQIKSKKLDLKSVQLQLDNLQQQWDSLRLVAPIDGVVTYLADVSLGQTMNAYETVLTIADPSRTQLVYTADDPADIASLQPNMPVEIKIDNKDITGKVVQTPSSVPFSSNQQVNEKNAKLLIVDSEDLKGDIGEMAELKIFKQRQQNVLIIPKSGLRTYLDRKYVQVLDGDRRKEVDVEVGMSTSTEVEIRRGLSEGDQIVLNN